MNSHQKYTHLPLINRIRAQLHQMTPVVKNIAHIVCSDPEAATHYTIQDLADKAGTSVSSVVRFCREIDFASLVELRLALTQEIARHDTEKLQNNPHMSILEKLKYELVQAMDIAVDFMDEDILSNMAEAVLKAKRIICFGLGASRVSADFLYCRLLRLGLNVSFPSDAHIAHMQIYGSHKNDVIFLFSASGHTIDILHSAQYAKDKGLITMGVINRAHTELEKACQYSTIVGVPENYISSGELSTKIGAFMFAEAFIRILLQKDKQLQLAYQNAASAISLKS